MLTEHDDGSITLSQDRARVCLESAWELDALGALLGKLEGDGGMAQTPAGLQTRALAVRVVALAGVLMMALSDTGADTGEFRKTVCPWGT